VVGTGRGTCRCARSCRRRTSSVSVSLCVCVFSLPLETPPLTQQTAAERPAAPTHKVPGRPIPSPQSVSCNANTPISIFTIHTTLQYERATWVPVVGTGRRACRCSWGRSGRPSTASVCARNWRSLKQRQYLQQTNHPRPAVNERHGRTGRPWIRCLPMFVGSSVSLRAIGDRYSNGDM